MSERRPSPLEQLAPGMHAVVCAIQGGAEFSGRLAGMGLVRGAPIEMLQNVGRGPLLVRVHETRIALGRGEAMKILVQESRDESAA